MGSPSLAAPAEIPLLGEPFWHESQAAKWVRNRENESAALEPDRKCKIKDEGGEVQMAFFAFLYSCGFYGQGKLNNVGQEP